MKKKAEIITEVVGLGNVIAKKLLALADAIHTNTRPLAEIVEDLRATAADVRAEIAHVVR